MSPLPQLLFVNRTFRGDADCTEIIHESRPQQSNSALNFPKVTAYVYATKRKHLKSGESRSNLVTRGLERSLWRIIQFRISDNAIRFLNSVGIYCCPVGGCTS